MMPAMCHRPSFLRHWEDKLQEILSGYLISEIMTTEAAALLASAEVPGLSRNRAREGRQTLFRQRRKD